MQFAPITAVTVRVFTHTTLKHRDSDGHTHPGPARQTKNGLLTIRCEDEAAPRDSSAAAIAACGFLELAEHLPPAEGLRWRRAAIDLVQKLDRAVGLLDDPARGGLLAKGTGKKPMEENVEVGLIYGDYYYLEALYRLRGGITLPW